MKVKSAEIASNISAMLNSIPIFIVIELHFLSCLAYSIPKDGSCRHACEYLQYQSVPETKDQRFSKYAYEHVDASFSSKSDIGISHRKI